MIQFFSSRDCPWWVNSWLQVSHLSFPEFQVFRIIVAKLHLNHRKASPCVFNFSFILSPFYYWSSSWRLYMMVRQGFFSFFNCSSRFLSKLWSAKLYSKINMVLNTCVVLGSSSILHLAFWSAILSTLSFEMVLYHSWQFTFMFHDSQVFKSDIFKSIISFKRSFQPINLFVGVILGYISPTAFPKECSYLWCLSMIKFSPSHLGEEVFHLVGVINYISCFRSGRISPLSWEVFYKPTTSLFVSLLVFQQLRSNLLGRVLSKIICGRSCHFLLHSLFQGSIFFYLFLPEALWCCSFHSSSRLWGSCSFRAYPFNRSVVFSFKFFHLIKFCLSFQPEWFQFLLVHCTRHS